MLQLLKQNATIFNFQLLDSPLLKRRQCQDQTGRRTPQCTGPWWTHCTDREASTGSSATPPSPPPDWETKTLLHTFWSLHCWSIISHHSCSPTASCSQHSWSHCSWHSLWSCNPHHLHTGDLLCSVWSVWSEWGRAGQSFLFCLMISSWVWCEERLQETMLSGSILDHEWRCRRWD